MNSGTALNEEYVLGRIEDQPGGLADGVSRVQQKKDSRMKCFACRGFGHRARDCPRKRDESVTERGNGRKNGKRGNATRGIDRSASNHEDSGEIPEDADKRSALTREGMSENAEIMPTKSVKTHRNGALPIARTRSGNREIFEHMNKCRGTVTIKGGMQMPIEGRGVVKFSLPKGEARLGAVFYVPRLVRNILSLDALYLAGFESVGSIYGCVLGQMVRQLRQESELGEQPTSMQSNMLILCLLNNLGSSKAVDDLGNQSQKTIYTSREYKQTQGKATLSINPLVQLHTASSIRSDEQQATSQPTTQHPVGRLLLLHSSTPVLLRLLHRRLVTLHLPLVHKVAGRLKRPLQVARRRLAEHVDLHEVRLQRALQRDHRLDHQRVRVLEVQVHQDRKSVV